MRFLVLMLSVWMGYAVTLHAAEPAPVSSPPPSPTNLTVLADPSLLLPLAQLARDYAKQTGTPLTIAVKDGEEAAQQIEQGLEAHLLLTANQPLVTVLRNRGLIDVFSARAFARTSLALVGSASLESRTDIARHISLAAILYAQPDLPIYITPTSTHEGNRALALMENPDYAELLKSRVIMVESREMAIRRLKRTPGFALLLATDALNDPALNVLHIFSAETAKPVNYEAVVLASESMAQTRQFIGYLFSPKGQQIFAHFGFQPPPQSQR